MSDNLSANPRHALTDTAIACRGLTKNYREGHGLFDLDLDVGRGEIFGFIGPNGAGKTTLIRLLMGLIRPTRGAASILGLDCRCDGLEIKRHVGYLPGELPEFPGARAGYVLTFLAGLRGGVEPQRISDLAGRLELDLGRRYSDLSHGNKQKVGLVQAFMHDPDVLILDEPTLGLDPLMQREFWRLIDEAAARGATVLLSSHVLAEVEAGCHRIGLVRAGHLVRAGSLDELREVRSHRLQVVLGEPIRASDLATVPGLSEVSVDGARVECTVRGPVGPLLDRLVPLTVIELDSRELSLEEVFLREFERTP